MKRSYLCLVAFSLAIFSVLATSLALASPDSQGLAEAPWPMYQHDPQHTGRSRYTGPDDPVLLWTLSLFNNSKPSSPVLDADGTLYVKGSDAILYAINPDGSRKWVYVAGTDETTRNLETSPLLGADGTIYIFQTNQLIAVSPDGHEQWSVGFGFDIDHSSPTISPDGTIYIPWAQSPRYGAAGTLYSYNRTDFTDETVWRFQTDTGIYDSPALGLDGTIYFSPANGPMYALNPNGTEKWRLEAAGRASIGSDGTIYIGGGGK